MKHFIPARQDASGAVLDPDEIHYLLRVRRLSAGDSITCVDKGGSIWQGQIELETGVTRIIRTGGAEPTISSHDRVEIHLVQGIPKGRKIDDIIRQACEIGVSDIHLWQSLHAIPKLDEKWETKEKRFSAVVREAAQQSGNRIPTRIHPPATTGELRKLLETDGTSGLVFYEKDIAEGSLHGYLSGAVDRVYLFIGPEGGIAPGELETLVSSGCGIVSLGSTILRTETAGIAAASAVQMILLEKKYWKLV